MRIYYVVLFTSLILIFAITRFKVDGGSLKYSLDGYIGERSWIEIFLMGLPMIIFSSIQYGVGSDYFAYVNMVESGEDRIEFLCKFLCSNLFNQLGNPQWFFVFTSIVIVYLFLSTILKFSPIPCLSVFIFVMTSVYTTITLNVIRYGMAIAFIFYSYRYIESRNLKKFLFCMFCAVGFHNIAFLFVPFYWIYGIKIRYSFLWSMTFVLYVFKEYIGLFVLRICSLSSYKFYIDVYLGTRPFSIKAILISVGIIICVMAFKITETRVTFFVHCLFVSVWFSFLGYWLPEVGRFCTMFSIFVVLLVPLVASKIREQLMKNAFLFCVWGGYTWIGRELGVYRVGDALVNSYQTIFDVGLSLF